MVFYSTEVVRRAIDRHRLVEQARLIHAPYGVGPALRPDAPDPDPAPPWWWRIEGTPFLLHVGSCIPRKRIDVLLEVFARVRARRPELVLVQVGGQWTVAQERLLATHGVQCAVIQVRALDVSVLAALYRRAAATLLTSDAEGFGLPIIEALACGGIVVASDLPVTREVGGDAAVYLPIADLERWSSTVLDLLAAPDRAPSREVRLAQAARFSWERHAEIIADAYRGILQGRPWKRASHI